MLWGVREAAGRFKRDRQRAAERRQESVGERVWELSGSVCDEKCAKMIKKKNSCRKTKDSPKKQNFKAFKVLVDGHILLTIWNESVG